MDFAVICICGSAIEDLSYIYLFLAEEKNLVEEVFNNAIDCLSDEDKKLPQVSNLPFLLPIVFMAAVLGFAAVIHF